MIYFIQAGENGPIKIGSSGNPPNRLKQLQTNHYNELKIIGVIAGGLKEERDLQNRFALHKFRKETREWFNPDKEIIDFIKENSEQGEIITVYKLENGEFRIIFGHPIRASWEAFFTFGTHDLRMLVDEERTLVHGLEGERSVIESWLRDRGESLVEAFRMVIAEIDKG